MSTTMTASRKPPRPKGGRYTDVPGEERSKQIIVRMTVSESTRLRAAAKTAGLSVSEFLRRRSLGVPVVPPRPKADAQTIFELNAIGNNLNQIAHHLNAGRDGEASYTLELALRELRAALAVVTEQYANR
jgi:hypothetical protein